ncbi:MAG TPA: PAS domain-containing protein, partial [Pyrinomonadaceae bacterium]|nr:PAS domain-containing protein [Pyrinomonadaceae bacterium]
MDTATVLILVLITITASLGLIQLVFWLAERERIERLAFFVASFGSSSFAIFELGMAHAETPEQFFHLFRLAQPSGLLHVVGIGWFVYSSLKTGRRWLFWTYVGVRVLCLVLNYVLPYGTNWKEVSGMGQSSILGGVLYYPVGISSPLALLPIAGYVVLLIFAFDTTIRAWRPGDRIRVAVFGLGTAFFSLTILGIVFGVVFGFFRAPIIVTPAILFVIVAISFQMLLDMQRAAGLSGRLVESEARLTDTLEQLHLSANAGEVGLWRRNFDESHFTASEKAKELFGFPAEAVVGPREFLEHVHEDDVVRVIQAMKDIEKEGAEFEIEFRIRRPDGEVRWIYSHGDIIRGDPMVVRGASVDITERKATEQEVH